MFLKTMLATLVAFLLAACNGAPVPVAPTEVPAVQPSKFTDAGDGYTCRRDDYDPAQL